MSLTNLAAEKSTKKFERIEDGTYAARIAQIIDLGVQEDEYEGEKKVAHKVFIQFEMPTETITIDGIEKPRWIGKEFPVSVHEKSSMYKLMQAADPDGKLTAKGRNLKGLLGLPLMLTVGSTAKGNAKVGGVARLMKGMAVADLSQKPVFFDLDGSDKEQFDKFPNWIKLKIQSGIGYEDTPFASGGGDSGTLEDMEDDNPF